MWELFFAAVEAKLEDSLQIRPTPTLQCRAIPYAVLQILIDALPAVQRFPEIHFLVVRTRDGICPIIIWAHHILGLAVEVQTDQSKLKFGESAIRVSIDCRSTASRFIAEALLLNDTQDVTFQAAVDPVRDPPLDPACRLPLKGYGSKHLNNIFHDMAATQEFVIRIVKACVCIVEEEPKKRFFDVTGAAFLPSRERILVAGQILFAQHEISSTQIDALRDEDSLLFADWFADDLIPIISKFDKDGAFKNVQPKKFYRWMRIYCHIILALSMVSNLEHCESVPLSVSALSKVTARIGIVTVQEAFQTIGILLLGGDERLQLLNYAAVVSCWGWSLCISSIVASDPSSLFPDLTIIRGVPSRNGERKEWIVDQEPGVFFDCGILSNEDTGYSITARHGDRCELKSFIEGFTITHLIGETETAFKVIKEFTCHVDNVSAYLQLGFRYMQHLYWRSCHLPSCEHAGASDTFAVPPQVWVFKGMLELIPPDSFGPWKSAVREGDAACRSIHVSLSSDNIALRWILLAHIQRYLQVPAVPQFSASYLKSNDCCIECAINYIRSGQPSEHEDIGLFNLVGLIT